MIEVKASQYGITALGHACYAAEGQDIVCAGFTSLMNCLAEKVRQMEEEEKLETTHIEVLKGHYEIYCTPKSEYMYEAAVVFNTIKIGISLIAAMYPENIFEKK